MKPFRENPSTLPLRRAMGNDLTVSINPLLEFFLMKPTIKEEATFLDGSI